MSDQSKPTDQMNAGIWYNYDTEEHDWREDAPFASIEEALPYIPIGPARNIFTIYVEDMGLDIPHAYLQTMEAVAGISRGES